MRLAVISDIHEDIINLERILKKIDSMGYDLLVCLGDISGFSVPHYNYLETRNASDCLSMLRDKQALIVPGNHDFHAARRIPEASDVFAYPEDWYRMDFREKEKLANGKVWLHEKDELDPLYSENDVLYLRTLPEYHVLETEHRKILLSHYIFPNLAGFGKGFYTHAKEFRSHFNFMRERNCPVSLTGHTHMKGIYSVSPHDFRHHRYGTLKLKEFPVCVGIHPVSRNNRRSGFCIFDTEAGILQAIRY